MLVYRCTEEFYEPEQYMGKDQCAKLERMVASGKIIVRLFNVV
jgi:hypothetical protein